ncbi:MAG: TIGR00282 family metallophosphoesterase [Bacillota bacterium]|jgi:metallophosphoesterase (TIGR00282 family)
MKILFIGDVVASPGRHIVKQKLPYLLNEYEIDFTIINGENLTGGAGINKKSLHELADMGVDCFTMGNHMWDNADIFTFIEQERRLVRPANFKQSLPGEVYRIYTLPAGEKLAVTNVVGQVYMPPADCPFAAMKRVLQEVREITPFIVVDIHAEATSEKMALGWYLDGQVSAVLGTHTHVQTNDARILPRGTAYLTDVGMTGPRDSVLGVDKDIIIEKMTTQLPQRFKPACRGDLQFNGVIIELGTDGKAQDIQLINFYEPSL